MKKKILILTVITIIVMILLNAITYMYGKNPIYNYVKNRYFPDILNLDEQFDISGYKTGEQKIETDGYTMVMDQYYFKEDRTTGCMRVKVTKSGCDMRELETSSGNADSLFNFGENIRYFFAGDIEGESMKAGTTAATSSQKFKVIRTKKAMYIYFWFGSDDGVLYNGKIYLHDRTAQKKVEYDDYAGRKKYAIGTFDIQK